MVRAEFTYLFLQPKDVRGLGGNRATCPRLCPSAVPVVDVHQPEHQVHQKSRRLWRKEHIGPMQFPTQEERQRKEVSVHIVVE